MIKKIVISICLISLLLFLQYGRSEHVVSSYVECYESTENQELVIIANKIIIIDRTQYAQKLLQKIFCILLHFTICPKKLSRKSKY